MFNIKWYISKVADNLEPDKVSSLTRTPEYIDQLKTLAEGIHYNGFNFESTELNTYFDISNILQNEKHFWNSGINQVIRERRYDDINRVNILLSLVNVLLSGLKDYEDSDFYRFSMWCNDFIHEHVKFLIFDVNYHCDSSRVIEYAFLVRQFKEFHYIISNYYHIQTNNHLYINSECENSGLRSFCSNMLSNDDINAFTG